MTGLLATLFLLLVGSLSPTAMEAADTKAVVERLERHYNSVRTLEGTFVQRYSLGSQTIVESGQVYFQKPDRMRWDYDTPKGKFFLADGKYAYLYMPSENVVRRQPLKEAAEWQATFAWFLGRVDLGRVFGDMELIRIHRPESDTLWQLRAQAKSDKQPFSEVWMDLNDHHQLLRLEIHQRDGGLMEFHFRNW
jgi:outer membrane lipoprotein carrier protein